MRLGASVASWTSMAAYGAAWKGGVRGESAAGWYPADSIRRVKAFITEENWPTEPEACAPEDADCLVFLETKLQNYVGEWEEEKTLRVLQRTLRKMTPNVREHALRLKFGERERELVRRAVT